MSDLTKTEAIELVRQYAFEEVEYVEVEKPTGRKLIHSRASGIGADWDIESVEKLIEQSPEIGWGDSLVGHQLFVMRDNGKPIFFDVRKPNE